MVVLRVNLPLSEPSASVGTPQRRRSCFQVIRVRTRETLCQPDISSLIMRGANAAGLLSSGAVMAELARDISREYLGLFVGFEDDGPRGVITCHLPTSAFHLAPMLTLAYSNRANRALAVELGRRLREWIVENGFDHAVTNNLWHTDRAFLRSFKHFGKVRTIGSAVRFDFREIGDA